MVEQSRSALITGICGQDGAYLAQHLLANGYEVIGTHRSGEPDIWRLEKLAIAAHPKLTLKQLCLSDTTGLNSFITQQRVDEIYNLAAVSTLKQAEENPLLTSQVNGLAPVAMLEAIRRSGRKIRFFQASSAEIYGRNRAQPQTENTPLAPDNVYAVAKAYAHQMVEYYRRHHQIFACNGILYNHESPLRGSEFVTRKISDSMLGIANGSLSCLEIGNLAAQRDWGYAKDYVQAMHKMLSVDQPDSYILSTGKLTTIREFVELAATGVGIRLAWEGAGMDEVGINQANGKKIVVINPKYYRNEDHTTATGNPSKVKAQLAWAATTSVAELCRFMLGSTTSQTH
ncbi:MAG: GDP-mannose 4,6-dehydratase [Pseudomonadota bacterium]